MPEENPVVSFLNKMADLILLNLLFLICCIPVITVGPAVTALYAVSLRSVRCGDGYVVQTFFRSFRQNFKQSFVAGIAGLCFVLLLFVDLFFWRNADLGAFSTSMTVVSVCVGYLVFIVFLWLFPVIAKLENPLKVQIKNAAAMAVAHFFPYTLIVSAIVFAAAYMAYTSIIADVLMLLVGFALFSYVCSFFFYKVFAKYISEEPVGTDDPLYGPLS